MSVNSFENYPMNWRPRLEKRTGTLYKELSEQLEKAIQCGQLKPGTKLPPQRELADYLDVNLSTITKAYKLCSLKGLLQTTIGRGTYIAYDVMNSRYLWPDNWKNPQVIPMGATRPDENSYKDVRNQLMDLLSESDCTKWFDYGTEQDMLWHRRAGALLMEREGFAADPENVFLTSGAQNALMAALLAVCTHGDAVGADPLTYPGLKGAASALGIRLIPLPYNGEDINFTALAATCQKMLLKALYLMPQNQNPTTRTMSSATKQALAKFADAHQLSIIEDASYNLLTTRPASPIASLLPSQTFFISGLSKGIAPGLRLAYMAIPPRYHEAITTALYTMSITVSPLMSELAARLLASGAAWKTLAMHQKETIARSQLTKKYLGPFLTDADDACIFRWLRLPDNCAYSGSAFEQLALQNGVQVYAAERFALGDSSPENAVRLAITAPVNRSELEKGLKILQNMLHELQNNP